MKTRSKTTTFLFFACVALMAAFPEDLTAIRVIQVGAMQVYPLDLLIAVCLLAAMRGRLARYLASLGRSSIPTIAVLLSLLLGVVLGLAQNGYRAIGETRVFFPLITIVFPLSLIDPEDKSTDELSGFFNTLLVVGGVSAFLMFWVEMVYGGRFYISEAYRSSWGRFEDFRGLRVLGTGQTYDILMLSTFLFLSGGNGRTHRAVRVLFSVVLISLAIYTQNRTAVFAWIAGVSVLGLLRLGPMAMLKIYFGAFALGLVALAIEPEMFNETVKTFASGFDPGEDDTGLWRVMQLDAAIDQGIQTPVFGQGLGGYYYFEIPGLPPIEDLPHNQYVLHFLKLGAIGLVALLFLVGAQLKMLIRVLANGQLSGGIKIALEMYLVLLVSQLVYGLAYPFVYQFGSFVCIGSLLLASTPQRSLDLGHLKPPLHDSSQVHLSGPTL
jgi:hypothetical protein